MQKQVICHELYTRKYELYVFLIYIKRIKFMSYVFFISSGQTFFLKRFLHVLNSSFCFLFVLFLNPVPCLLLHHLVHQPEVTVSLKQLLAY